LPFEAVLYSYFCVIGVLFMMDEFTEVYIYILGYGPVWNQNKVRCCMMFCLFLFYIFLYIYNQLRRSCRWYLSVRCWIVRGVRFFLSNSVTRCLNDAMLVVDIICPVYGCQTVCSHGAVCQAARFVFSTPNLGNEDQEDV